MKHAMVAAGVLCLCATAWTGTVQAREQALDIHPFDNAGNLPSANVTFWHGQIFGSTTSGGNGKCGCGTLYRLTPGAGGKGWTYETLYTFQGGADGGSPSQVTVAANGDVYGYSNANIYGLIFRLVPPTQKGSSWTLQTLYTFTADGGHGDLFSVSSPLIVQGQQVYGIALGGSLACGQIGCGSVFRLDPPAQGQSQWRLATLYAFPGNLDTGDPANLAGPDASGAFYVDTQAQQHAVVQLAPPADQSGRWTARKIATFPHNQYNYLNPYGLIMAPNGTLYGISTEHRGDVFSLTPPSGGGYWTKTELARVVIHGGYLPTMIAPGPNSSLIGVTYGDQDLYFGNAFQLTPPANGAGGWTYKQLWDFNYGPDQNPTGIVAGRHRDLFGVLSGGGYGDGSLFELTP